MARRLLAGSKLVIATHNNGKLVEMADLLRPYGLEAVSAGALGLPEPEETGSTLRRERRHQGACRSQCERSARARR